MGLDKLVEIAKYIWELIQSHIFDWIITGVVTYFTVRSATKNYYYKSRKQVAHNIMELGLRSMYTLPYSEALPNTAKVIFVEYGKHSLLMTPKQLETSLCAERGLFNLRETVTSCGNSMMDISKYRPKDYGVLGLANKKGRVLVFDFAQGQLWQFLHGNLSSLDVQTVGNYYKHGAHVLSKTTGNDRKIMIAVPIIKDYNGSKLLGGVTFDIEPSDMTVFRTIDENDPADVKKEKLLSNKRVIEVAVNTALYLKTAYFNEKGEETS